MILAVEIDGAARAKLGQIVVKFSQAKRYVWDQAHIQAATDLHREGVIGYAGAPGWGKLFSPVWRTKGAQLR